MGSSKAEASRIAKLKLYTVEELELKRAAFSSTIRHREYATCPPYSNSSRMIRITSSIVRLLSEQVACIYHPEKDQYSQTITVQLPGCSSKRLSLGVSSIHVGNTRLNSIQDIVPHLIAIDQCNSCYYSDPEGKYCGKGLGLQAGCASYNKGPAL